MAREIQGHVVEDSRSRESDGTFEISIYGRIDHFWPPDMVKSGQVQKS